MSETFVVAGACGAEKEFDSLSEAQEGRDTHDVLCDECSTEEITINAPKENEDTASDTPDVVSEESEPDTEADEATDSPELMEEQMLTEQLPDDPPVDTDPLDVLPDYMITVVDGQPSLNKRGVSVLAYHYDITVTDKETVAYPHETDYESAIVEITVEGSDGRVFVGAGEAHVDETPKHQLLRMAETRAYKRAVIFATGTGIVGYQEIMEELQ